ncbi:MAG: hypothetical protein JXA33_20255, partial [Anaerolineae bacterium]|nr:hypothetical protein [Anaerolineae bacterium]
FSVCHGGCRAQALLLGEVQDPLIQTPLSERFTRPESTLRLFAGLCPVGNFAVQQEQGMTLIVHKGQVVPVPEVCIPLLPHLQGDLSLRGIQQTYGDAALQWVGMLYQQGIVDWA